MGEIYSRGTMETGKRVSKLLQKFSFLILTWNTLIAMEGMRNGQIPIGVKNMRKREAPWMTLRTLA